MSSSHAPTAYGRRDTWREHAACLHLEDPNIMFPDTSQIRERQAIAVCQSCPVRQACLTDAFTHPDDYSVRAGTTAKARRAFQAGNPGCSPDVLAGHVHALRPGRVDLGAYLDARTEFLPDGHARWFSSHCSLTVDGESFTPMKLAFTVGHGRRPEGTVRAACGVIGCLTPDHLTDNVLRAGRRTKRATVRDAA
ncbi:WhiB family transcriptional regulator [Streptomyces sp. NPDC048416]|uniref:WhiB family transcriptional regulator n=1 Tax=Streptomyces sp. NPDC048416 TaxID=3365546 RepID=UPI00371435FF